MREASTSRRSFLAGAAAGCLLSSAWARRSTAVERRLAGEIELPVRWQEKAGDRYVAKVEVRKLPADKTAIVICDLWNQHWCASATRRCGEIARQMAPLVDEARAAGVAIVHAPSDTLKSYQDHPARKRALALSPVKPPTPIQGWCSLDKAREGDLPIDDSDGGCDCQPQCKQGAPWTRQHAAISIADNDFISDDGRQVYSYFKQRGVENVLYMGVHTNMCVLGRSFGIRQMTRLGLNALLVRDLTDTMYNPRMKPFVSHEEGTALVIAHIERNWCPTLESQALRAGIAG